MKLFDPDTVFTALYYAYVQGERQTEVEADCLADLLQLSPHDRILDIGCGNGRMTRELYARGFTHMTGIDHAQAMLDAARRDGPDDLTYLHADMASFTAETPFDKMFSLFSSFGHAYDDENEAYLRQMAANLVSGGRCLIDIVSPYYAIRAFKEHVVYEHDGVPCEVRNSLDLVHSTTTSVFTAQPPGQDPVTFTYTARFYMVTELDALLRKHGLTTTAVYGGYAKEPLTLDSTRLVVVARKD